MPEADRLTERLQQLAQSEASRPDLERVRLRVASAIASELASGGGRRWVRGRLRLPRSGLATIASIAVTCGVIAVVLTALSRHQVASPSPVARPTPHLTPLPSRPTRSLLIREDSREPWRADAALLTGFAVLHGGGAPRTRGGETVSHPALSAMPTQILELASPRRRNHIDISMIRRVRFTSGVRIWVLPGRQSLCLAIAVPWPGHGVPINNSGCVPAAPALHARLRFSAGRGATSVRAGVLTVQHPTVTIRRNGRTQTLTPPFGVYALATHH